jgi:hypothetical protein
MRIITMFPADWLINTAVSSARRHTTQSSNRLDKGGHFAAWKQPELLTAELGTAFRPLRGVGS